MQDDALADRDAIVDRYIRMQHSSLADRDVAADADVRSDRTAFADPRALPDYGGGMDTGRGLVHREKPRDSSGECGARSGGANHGPRIRAYKIRRRDQAGGACRLLGGFAAADEGEVGRPGRLERRDS